MNESANTQKSNLIEAIRDNASSAVMRAIIGNRGLTKPRPSQVWFVEKADICRRHQKWLSTEAVLDLT